MYGAKEVAKRLYLTHKQEMDRELARRGLTWAFETAEPTSSDEACSAMLILTEIVYQLGIKHSNIAYRGHFHLNHHITGLKTAVNSFDSSFLCWG